MPHTTYTITASVWQYPGGGWFFITLPEDISEDIKRGYSDRAKSFGSLPVTVTVGETFWDTSIFPDSKIGSYLLPLKAAVRKKEHIQSGDSIQVKLTLQIM